ncbi:MAG: sulfurtransferase [Erythrobacter sp.]
MNDLISIEWLAANLHLPDLVILDASKHLPGAERDAAAEFTTAHIPGARYFDLGRLVDETSAVPMACPRTDQLVTLLQELGVSSTDHIIFYDDSAVKTSARAWFLCRENGFASVSILDGGLAKWKAEGHPLESGDAALKPSQPISLSTQGRIRMKADMLANIDSKAEQILDARDQGRFSGTTQDTVHNLPSGHIPGSHNLPFTRLFADDGTYKSPEQLRGLFRDTGIDLDGPVTTTCGSGVTASVLLFALHLIGKQDTALYDGSWLEWAGDAATPKAVSGNDPSTTRKAD